MKKLIFIIAILILCAGSFIGGIYAGSDYIARKYPSLLTQSLANANILQAYSKSLDSDSIVAAKRMITMHLNSEIFTISELLSIDKDPNRKKSADMIFARIAKHRLKYQAEYDSLSKKDDYSQMMNFKADSILSKYQ